MKIGVTGASGHVGSNLCRELLSRGHSIKALQHKNITGIKDLDIEFVCGDLDNPEALDQLCEGVDAVYHLAARISIDGKANGGIASTNVGGTSHLLSSVKRQNVKRLIHFSSIHALSHEPLDEPMDESRPMLLDSRISYERSKAEGEVLVRKAMDEGLDAVILNPTSILGPNDYKPSLAGQFLINLYNGHLPGLIKGGYNWVDVRDVAQAAANALDTKASGRYILAGSYVSVLGVSERMSAVTGRKTTKRMIPLSLARIGVPFIKIWSRLNNQTPIYTHESLDILQLVNKDIHYAKAERDLGFKPRSLDDTLVDTINWFSENGFI